MTEVREAFLAGILAGWLIFNAWGIGAPEKATDPLPKEVAHASAQP